MIRWAILTGEYPPQAGGVSDYTSLVAEKLKSGGDEVIVFAPASAHDRFTGKISKSSSGIELYRLPDIFGPKSLLQLDRLLRSEPVPTRILIQYVPHAFGFKALNLPFAFWVRARLGRIAPVWVMFHEVAFPFSWRPLRHGFLAVTHRLMARLIAAAADRVFISIPAWGKLLAKIYPRVRRPEWLPVPCSVSTEADPKAVELLEARYKPAGGYLVGHFGSFGQQVGELFEAIILRLKELVPNVAILLVGRGGTGYRAHFIWKYPLLEKLVHATGDLDSQSVTEHLRACDLVVLPFAEGVSSRRTRVMACLANGVPVLSNLGSHSEDVWKERGLGVAPSADPEVMAQMAADLIGNASLRRDLAKKGMEIYRELFSVENTVEKLHERVSDFAGDGSVRI